MNKCLNCGNEIINGDKFCRKCGTKVQVDNNNYQNNTNINNTGFNNNLNSNVIYNENQPKRKDSLSTPVIVVIGLVIVILFVVFMPTIKNESNNEMPTYENTNKTENKIPSNSNNNSTIESEVMTFKGIKLTKLKDCTYKVETSGTNNILTISSNNKDEMVAIEGVYKISIADVNKQSSSIKQTYINAGYDVGKVKYTTYKNKRIYTLEVSKNSYKMLMGYYELDNNSVVGIAMYDKNYTRYNYNSYSLVYDIFNNSTTSSRTKYDKVGEIRGNIEEIMNKLLTKQ